MKVLKSLMAVGLFGIFLVILPVGVKAVCDPNKETATELGCIPNDPSHFVSAIYAYGLGLIGLVSVIFIITGGYQILSSRGDEQMVRRGRGYITYAIIGIVVALAGFTFYDYLAKFLRIPGFG